MTKPYPKERIEKAEAFVKMVFEKHGLNPTKAQIHEGVDLYLRIQDNPKPATGAMQELSPLQKLMGPDFRVLDPDMQARLQHVMDTTPIMDVEVDGSISSFLPHPLDPEKVAELTEACDKLTGGEFSRLLDTPALTFEERVAHRLKMAWVNDQISLKFDGGEADLETVRKYLRHNASYYPYETRDQWYRATGGVTSNPNGGLDFEYPESDGIYMSDINPPKPTDAQVEHLLAQLAKVNAVFKGQ